MESTGRPAEPIAVGVWATAKQSFSDLFKWEQRVKITNEYGESRTEWQRPLPLRNPISLLAQLTPTAWVFFIVGFASWTVRVCVCVCVTEREREETNPEHSPISSKRKTTKKNLLQSPPPYSKEKNIPSLINSPYLLLHLGRRLRLPRPQHPNYQTGRLLRYHQYQHHQCHYSHAAATFCRSGSFWATRRSVWAEMADGMLCL